MLIVKKTSINNNAYIQNVIEHNMTSQIIILKKILDKDSLTI